MTVSEVHGSTKASTKNGSGLFYKSTFTRASVLLVNKEKLPLAL